MIALILSPASLVRLLQLGCTKRIRSRSSARRQSPILTSQSLFAVCLTARQPKQAIQGAAQNIRTGGKGDRGKGDRRKWPISVMPIRTIKGIKGTDGSGPISCRLQERPPILRTRSRTVPSLPLALIIPMGNAKGVQRLSYSYTRNASGIKGIRGNKGTDGSGPISCRLLERPRILRTRPRTVPSLPLALITPNGNAKGVQRLSYSYTRNASEDHPPSLYHKTATRPPKILGRFVYFPTQPKSTFVSILKRRRFSARTALFPRSRRALFASPQNSRRANRWAHQRRCPSPPALCLSASCLPRPGNRLPRFFVRRPSPLRLPLIPLLLAASQRQLNLHPTPFKIKASRDQRQPPLLRLAE